MFQDEEINQPMSTIFNGVVRAGLGTGANYVALPYFFDHFVKFLGKTPFQGTLNIHLDAASKITFLAAIEQLEPLIIPECNVDGRNLWRVSCYRACLWKAGRGSKHDRVRCLALRFDNPGHPIDVVEMVSTDRLRLRLDLNDGDAVSFKLLS